MKSVQYEFGPFRLDMTTQQVWRGTQLIPLQPRPLAVLGYLLAHAGEVVDSHTMLKAVWRQTQIGKAALKVCIRAIREALDDDAATPRYIETIGRVGYRFIAPVAANAAPVSCSTFKVPGLEIQHSALSTQHSILVGREAELAQLHNLLRRARQGMRQTLFVTGEPGIGKTAVVDAFLQTLDARFLIGRGQCLEQYGEGEAYLPVLEAVGQLCRGPAGSQMLEVLRRIAPTWIAQLPQFVSEDEAEALRARALGTTPARMLREMAEALAVLAQHRTLVLVIEDLQWSDRSTLDLLAYVAQRRERAQLCVVGTHRPVGADSESLLARLKTALQIHGQCVELPLAGLTAEAVAAHLQRRFAGRSLPEDLGAWIHRRSEGNALFMTALADYYEREGQMIEEIVPATIRQLIAHQLTQLTTAQQQVVEGASVAGVEFGSAMVAALGIEPDIVDAVCAELSRSGQLIRSTGVVEWPDGALSGRYQFCHALYPQVAYYRLPEERRVRLHRRMGERLEAGYGKRARERAAELAMHFERGRILEKAVKYYQLAGENALQRSAHQEAVLEFTKGLELVESLPQTPTRLAQQLSLQTLLAPALMAVAGHTSLEAEAAFQRARELCEQMDDAKRLFFVRLGLFRLYNARSEYHCADEQVQACLTLATERQEVTFVLGAHYGLGVNAFYQGRLSEARRHSEHGMALYDPKQHQIYALQYGFNPLIGCRLYGAVSLWLQGYPDQAAEQIAHTFHLVQELTHPFTRVFSHILAAVGFQLLGQEREVIRQAEAGAALAEQDGFPFWRATGSVLAGWGQVTQGEVVPGIQQMRTGLTSLQNMNAQVHRTHYLTLLAEAVGQTGDYAQALQLIEEALVEGDRSGEGFYEAEMWRLKGELLLARTDARHKAATQGRKPGKARDRRRALTLQKQSGTGMKEEV